MTAPRVAVIGGGLAGLAAAGRLQMLGINPTVFERDANVGGLVRTAIHDGWIFEDGPCLAAEPDPAVRVLLDAAGLGECTVRAAASSRNRYIVRDGAPVPLPHTTSDFASSPLLSIAGRLRLLKERFIAPERDATDESVDAFARRRFGDEMAERVFDPLLASTAAGDPREVLARYAFPAAVGHERRTGSGLQGSARARMEARRRNRGAPQASWSCTGGMAEVPRRLAASIGDLRTGATVSRVEADATRAMVTASGAAESYDGVILAVPVKALGAMQLKCASGDQLGEVAAVPCQSIATVSLGFRRDDVGHALDAGRLLVPTVEHRAILSAVFASSLFESHAPAGHVLITAYVGGARRPDAIDLDDAALVKLVMSDITSLLGARAEPVIARVARWRDALPQAVAGHGRRIAAADAIEGATGAVAFAGSWRDGLSVGEVLLGGVRAAERLAIRRRWLEVPRSH